jgi:hypothetical protein
MLATVIAPSRAYAIFIYIYPAAGFDPAPFGHEEPVTPDERAPFIRGRFFARSSVAPNACPHG